MATNLALDDKLILAIQKQGGFKTKKEAVTAAMLEYKQKMERMELRKLFGTIEYFEGHDPKKMRRKRHA